MAEGDVLSVLKGVQKKDGPKRSKRTLVLSTPQYEEFDALCRKMGRYPSEIIDEFIGQFLRFAPSHATKFVREDTDGNVRRKK